MARCRSPPPPARTASPASAEAGDLCWRSASAWLLFTSATAEALCWTLHLMSGYSFTFLDSMLHSSHLCLLPGLASKVPVFLWPVSLCREWTTLASTEHTQPSQPAMSSQHSLHSHAHPAPAPAPAPALHLPHLVCTANSSWGLRRQENTLLATWPDTWPPLLHLREPRMLT